MTIARQPSALRRALSDFAAARSAAFSQARRELNLGDGDARALMYICERPGVRAADIAAHLGITAAGATALIDRLVERGIATRDYDPSDRRVIRINPAISLADDPWSSLCRFDDDFDEAIALRDRNSVEELTRLLSDATAAIAR
jgi:hypothetical protein